MEMLLVIFTIYVIAGTMLANRPRLAALLVLFCSTLEINLFSIEGFNLSIAELSALLLVCGWMIRFLYRMEPVHNSRFEIILLLLFLSFLLPSLLTLNPVLALLQTLKLLLFMSSAYFIVRSFHTDQAAGIYLLCLYATLAIAFPLALVQVLNQPEDATLHLSGGFLDWNYFPIYLALLLPFLRYEMTQHTIPWKRILLFIVSVIIAIVGVAAKSRSGTAMIVLSIMLLVFLDEHYRIRWHWLTLFVFVLLLIFTAGAAFSDVPLAERFQIWLISPKMQERLQNNLLCLNVFLEHPLLGVGVGQYPAYLEWKEISTPYPVMRYHSSLFLLLAETGIPGAMMWFFFLVHLFTLTLEEPTFQTCGLRRAVSLAIIILIASSLLYSIHENLFTWCLIGLLYSFITRRSVPEQNMNAQPVKYKIERSDCQTDLPA